MSSRPKMQMFGTGSKTDRVLAALDGRGESPPVPTSESEILLDLIDLPASQPRKYFDPEKMAQLISSVSEKGILEPILVRPKPCGRYELVAGERRYRSAKEAKLIKIPAIVRELSDTEVWEIALVENLQREDLNPVEEVEGILQLLCIKLDLSQPEVVSLFNRLLNEQKGLVNSNVTVNDDHPNSNVTVRVKKILEAVGITNWLSFATNKLPLLNLPDDVLETLRQGKLEYTKAKAIAKVKDDEQRRRLLEQTTTEKLSLSQIKQEIAAVNSGQKSQPSTEDKLTLAFKTIRKAKLSSDKQKQLDGYLNKIYALLGIE